MSNNTNGHGSSNGNHAPYSTALPAKKGSKQVNLLIWLIVGFAIIIAGFIGLYQYHQSNAKNIQSDLRVTLNYDEDTVFTIPSGHFLWITFQIYTDNYDVSTEANKWLDVTDDANKKLVLLGNTWYGNRYPTRNTGYLIFNNNNPWDQKVWVKRTLAKNAQLTNN